GRGGGGGRGVGGGGGVLGGGAPVVLGRDTTEPQGGGGEALPERHRAVRRLTPIIAGAVGGAANRRWRHSAAGSSAASRNRLTSPSRSSTRPRRWNAASVERWPIETIVVRLSRVLRRR